MIRFLTFDANNPNSIISCLRAARENARTIREAISPEMWEQINTYYLMVNAAASDQRMMESPYSFFSEVKRASHLFDGVTEATMLHDEGWHFYRVGRLLERADKTSRLLDVKYFILLPSAADVGTPLDDIQWAAVLRSASALEMYRKRHGHIAPDKIIEFLVLDREFPRSVHYCLTSANDSLHAISGTPVGMYRNPAGAAPGPVARRSLPTPTPSRSLPGVCMSFLTRCKRSSIWWTSRIFDTFFALRPIGGSAALSIEAGRNA